VTSSFAACNTESSTLVDQLPMRLDTQLNHTARLALSQCICLTSSERSLAIGHHWRHQQVRVKRRAHSQKFLRYQATIPFPQPQTGSQIARFHVERSVVTPQIRPSKRPVLRISTVNISNIIRNDYHGLFTATSHKI